MRQFCTIGEQKPLEETIKDIFYRNHWYISNSSLYETFPTQSFDLFHSILQAQSARLNNTSIL